VGDPVTAINPGVARLVEWLNDNGFPTCDSGDGETHDYACDREGAYVSIDVVPGHIARVADRLLAELTSVGVVITPQPEAGGKFIQATYDPANRIAIIDLVGVTDADIPETVEVDRA